MTYMALQRVDAADRLHCFSVLVKGGSLLPLPFVDRRGLGERIAHIVLSSLKMIGMLFLRLYDYICHQWDQQLFLTPQQQKDNRFVYPLEELPWAGNRDVPSEGLNLCIHGLRGSPLNWSRYTSQLKNEQPGMHTLAPWVALNGNCPIETAAEPFVALVEDYLRKYPRNPVNIIGTSNGGRIAAYLESRIDPVLLKESRLTIVSIAGVHYGTTVVSRAKAWGVLWFAGLHTELANEFEWGSDKAVTLFENWRERQMTWRMEQIRVNHLFYASTEDEQVQPCSASMPLPDNSVLPTHEESLADDQKQNYFYTIYHGESHISVVERALGDVMKRLFPQPIRQTAYTPLFVS